MIDFERCRVCLASANEVELKSLFENDGDKAKFFEKCFGISLVNDIHEALICDKCSAKVDEVRLFIDKARCLNDTFSDAARSTSDGPPACRCCQSASSLRTIAEHGPDIVQLLLTVTGIHVPNDYDKVFICSKCKNKLNSAELLDSAVNEYQKEHFGSGSSKEGFHACSHCDKVFATARKLSQHLATIDRIKMYKFKCNFCEYSAANCGNLVEHIATHINPPKKQMKKRGQKIFVKYEDCMVCLHCSICKDASTSVKDLRIHLVREHLEKLEFFCDQCEYRCFKKSKLLDHITCKHVIKSCGDMYNKERPSKCTVEGCAKRFKTKLLLKQHWNVAHSGISHTCWWCQKSYTRKTTLNRHQETCTGICKPSNSSRSMKVEKVKAIKTEQTTDS